MASEEFNTGEAKAAIRREIRHALSAIPPAVLDQASAAIRAHLRTWIRAANPGGILFFSPMPDEPDIQDLIRECRAVAHLPAVRGDTAVARPLREATLSPGYRGIIEPVTEARSNPSDITLALVPGRAFSPEGARLGRGGGHYDRLLATLPASCQRIGVSFACQIRPSLPREAHDIPVHHLVTELGPQPAAVSPPDASESPADGRR